MSKTLAQQVYDLIAKFDMCSLDAIHAQFGAKRGDKGVTNVLYVLRCAGKIVMVEPRKYRAL